MSNSDALGDRMKRYEKISQVELPPRSYTLIRLDGKAFHTYTRGFDRPFDQRLINWMNTTALELCKQISGVKFAYVQSDEITLLLTDFESIATEAWFGGNLQKIVSVSASIATCAFNKAWIDDFPSFVRTQSQMAMFDSRAWSLADPFEVDNVFRWRQQDATRNSIQMVGQSKFSHKKLQGKSCNEIQEMLFTEHGINWNDFSPALKRGRIIRKVDGKWTVDNNIPVFTQEPSYLRDMIPLIPNWDSEIGKIPLE